jgi:3-mercaptopyruvate sulfurtransferase SseA
VVAESDEDVLLYETGHILGAVKIDWHTDLNDPVTRDYVSGEGFARLMSSKGISRDTTIVFYGDKSNWWAPTPCGSALCSGTRTCGCWTAAARSGSRRGGR